MSSKYTNSLETKKNDRQGVQDVWNQNEDICVDSNIPVRKCKKEEQGVDCFELIKNLYVFA